MIEHDNPRVSEILCKCYCWLDEREGFSADELRELIEARGSEETVQNESSNELYLVACQNQAIVGMVSVKENEITKLYIDPAFHRQGIGTILFQAAENWIIQNNYFEMKLVAIGKTPIPFYQARGLKIAGYKQGRSGRNVAIMKKLLPVTQA